MLGLRQRHGEWVELRPSRENEFSLADLEWCQTVRKLVIGATSLARIQPGSMAASSRSYLRADGQGTQVRRPFVVGGNIFGLPR